MQLVNQDATDSPSPTRQPPLPADLEEAQLYKRLNELLFRILQLDQILHERSSFDSDKAAHLRDQIRKAQKELEQIYDELDSDDLDQSYFTLPTRK